jgi:hypothetical protein
MGKSTWYCPLLKGLLCLAIISQVQFCLHVQIMSKWEWMITERVSDYWESEWLLIEWVITERVSDYWESEWLLREWMITERVSDYWESEWLLREWVITERVSDYWESEWLLRVNDYWESEWLLREWVITERVSDYCLSSNEQFFSNIMGKNKLDFIEIMMMSTLF